MIINQPKKDYGTFDPTNWVGVVENSHDKLNIGMYKVRIIGLHSPNVEEVPVDNLPWAHGAIPLSQGYTTSVARPGEWVVGYFLDPETLQYPIIIGILPGIQSTNVVNVTSSGSKVGSYSYNKSAGFVPQLTQEQADKNPVLPKGIVTRSVGQPTTAPLARGVYENSSISVADANAEHVCDFKKKLRYDIAIEKLEVYKFVETSRAEIKAYFTSTSSSPMSTAVQAAIKQIKEILKMIKKAADFITDVAKAITDFIKYCNDLIAYIASLPAKLAAQLQKCLQEFTDSLSDALSFDSVTKDGNPSPFSEIKSLVETAKETGQAIETAVSATTTTVAQATILAVTAKSFGRV
jgi:hypothetical protein